MDSDDGWSTSDGEIDDIINTLAMKANRICSKINFYYIIYK